MNKHSPLLEAIDLCKSYPDGPKQIDILKKINLSIQPGSMNAIMGASGSGKSTLLHLLSGLDRATSGTILFKQQEVTALTEKERAHFFNKEIGFIYQFHHLLSDFTALENVAMPLLIGRTPIKEAQTRALTMLDFLGLAHRAHHRSSELSGGERQRVAIARAVINEPALVFADEPTGNLDHENATLIFDLLQQINATYHTAFLIVTHDVELGEQMTYHHVMRQGTLTSTRRS